MNRFAVNFGTLSIYEISKCIAQSASHKEQFAVTNKILQPATCTVFMIILMFCVTLKDRVGKRENSPSFGVEALRI